MWSQQKVYEILEHVLLGRVSPQSLKKIEKKEKNLFFLM
jgi:hypothetical protein